MDFLSHISTANVHIVLTCAAGRPPPKCPDRSQASQGTAGAGAHM